MSVVTEKTVAIAAAMVAEEATRCLWENISEQGQAQWLSRMRAALAAVAPLIAAQDRERAARAAQQKGYDLSNLDERNGCFAAAAAIHALGDAT
tara:strand:- start:322 stop:603 length:282 start_codon:yes stop_codon:yes gene_type:complete